MESFRIQVGKEGLSFAAAHFVAFQEGGCEPLHGHEYRVGVTLEGRPNEAGYLYDFVALERAVRELIAPLDHRVLLPARGDRVRVRAEGEEVTATCGERRYVFPASDVRLLPISNATAEALAAHLAAELAERLRGEGIAEALTRLEVEVEESPGHSARYACDLAG